MKNHVRFIPLGMSLIFLLTFVPALGVWAAVPGNPNALKGGTFYRNLGGEPTTINPVSSSDQYASYVQDYVMESLLTRDSDKYDFVPNIAESYEISKDGMSFTFKLRQGVKWHDGTPLTAEDVKFSFDCIFDPVYKAAQKIPYFESFKGVTIVDPQTVRFDAKDVYFGNLESAATMTIVPKHIYGDAKAGVQINKKLVGTGPYVLDKYEQGKRIVLKRNSNWWGNALPYFKGRDNFNEIVLRFITEDTIGFEALKKGELDFEDMSPEVYQEKAQGPEWGKKVFKVKVESKATRSTGFVAWNLRNPLFSDKNIRIALAHLMNRKLMNEKFRYGMSLLATGPWYQQNDYASRTTKAIPFDLKKASDLFKGAGWSDSDKDGVLDKMIDGKKVDFRFTILNPSADAAKYLTLYKEDAKKAGVDINISQMEWNSFIKLVDERKFEALTMAWGGGSVDYDPKQIWHSASDTPSGSNFIGFHNAEVDKLTDEARKTMDRKKRIALLSKVYSVIADDAPYAFMFNAKYFLYGHTAKMAREKDTYQYEVGHRYWWTKP